MKNQVVLFGAGGHARAVIDALEARATPPLRIYDDDQKLWGSLCQGYEVVGGSSQMAEICGHGFSLIVAVARNAVRHRLVHELSRLQLRLVGVRHPSAIVSPRAKVAETAQLMAGVIVGANAQIGEHAILNTGAIVEHDCHVDDFAHIAPGARLAGAVTVSTGALVATGACAIPFRVIGAWATVGAGGVVTRDVPDEATFVGVPARDIGRRS